MENKPQEEIQDLDDIKIEVITDDLSLLGVPGVMVEVDTETAD